MFLAFFISTIKSLIGFGFVNKQVNKQGFEKLRSKTVQLTSYSFSFRGRHG